MPWEGLERVGFREMVSESVEESGGEKKLKKEELMKLKEMFESWNKEDMKWVLEDDVEMNEEWFGDDERRVWDPNMLRRSKREVVEFLVVRLSGTEFTMRDWKLSRMMKQSGLEFSEGQVLKILNGLGEKKCWKQMMAVVEWVYKDMGDKHYRSRFVYTKLLSILGKAGRPQEALDIFNTMRILNACVQSHQWKSVYWVFNQLRKSGLKPNGATYGLAMEVMLQSGKYDLVHELFRKMKKSGEAPKALTYKVIVRTLWCEGKLDEAVEAVRDMEQRGVVGTSGIYYELACCLCKSGRWQDAMLQVEKMKNISNTKPLEVTFTGMIKSSMEGGHMGDCISIFQHMKNHCSPNIGTVNLMLKVFGRTDMFSKAKELFEEIKAAKSECDPSLEANSYVVPDEYTYTSMLKASARTQQWEYFEYVYKEMVLSGYQIDQSKNASILVEASRVGKGFLLEHALDTKLEAGEIPHQLFFIEMIYQRLMPHLKSVKGSQDGLKNLLDALDLCDVTSEATFLNLKRSLQSLCRSFTSRDFSNSIAVNDTDVGSDDEEVNPPDDGSDAAFSESPLDSCTPRGVAAELKIISRPLDCISDEVELETTQVDEEIEALINVDDPHDSLIMKDWKERRKKGGMLIPFPFGQVQVN